MAFAAYAPLGHGQELADPVVTFVAAETGRTPAQVVLRWLVQQEGVAAIPKSATPERIRENLDVSGFALSPAQMAAISALARPDGRIITDPALAPAWD